jgi:hypothetical protein
MFSLYRSKTFLAGVASVIGGGVLVAIGNLEQGLPLVSTGLIGIFLRHSVWKLDPKNHQPRAQNGRFASRRG